jgi:hypothetical protein
MGMKGITIAKASFWLAIAISFFAGSCSAPDTPSNSNQKPYFDLKSYFTQELLRLKPLKEIIKKTTVNEHTEEITLDSMDFNSELQLFMDSDINRASWFGKYQIDTTLTASGEIARLNYAANDPGLRTQSISIDYYTNEVRRVEIVNTSNSALSKSKQHLVYLPKEGFSIESTQSIKFTGENSFLIEVRF